MGKLSVFLNTIRYSMKKNIRFQGFFHLKKSSIIVEKNSLLNIGKNVSCRKNLFIYISAGGVLNIGDNCYFNQSGMMSVRGNVTIEKNCIIGPNFSLFDHDHDFLSNDINNTFIKKEITIGEGTWIGANVTILKGTTIGKRCVVAAGTLLSGGVYPDDTIIYNEKVVKTKKINRSI